MSRQSDRAALQPVIGITCYVESVSRGDWVDIPSALLPHDYIRFVEGAGGIAVLIPPRVDGDDAMATRLLEHLDGLILAGGADMDPRRYGATPHARIQATRPDRDAFETALANATAEVDMPTLGVCRGMQVMAVANGGHLEQHLPDRVGHDRHAPARGIYGAHAVRTLDGSRVRELLGTHLTVPSYHHQAVVDAPGYLTSAWADDQTIEAMEDPTATFRLGVQWHPEAGHDDVLFKALVRATSDVHHGAGSRACTTRDGR